MGLLALTLASESVLRLEIMAQYSPLGTKTRKVLSQQELYCIKMTVFELYPHFYQKPQRFEEVWKLYHTAIKRGVEGSGKKHKSEHQSKTVVYVCSIMSVLPHQSMNTHHQSKFCVCFIYSACSTGSCTLVVLEKLQKILGDICTYRYTDSHNNLENC